MEIDSQHLAAPYSNQVMATAKVCEIAQESPSVKSLRLLVADKDFSFKAGQWVDFFIPGVSVVGGFSICSSPQLLEQERIIELAVKYTDHPPAIWVHKKCTLDSEVALRVGGEFFFDPQPTDAPRNLVLIAGGVGINPLLSILRHSADLHRDQADRGRGYDIGAIKLFYSAKNTSELLFKILKGMVTPSSFIYIHISFALDCVDPDGTKHPLESSWVKDCNRCFCGPDSISCCSLTSIPQGYDKEKCQQVFHPENCTYSVVEKANPGKSCPVPSWVL
ncbi:Oxidoreductase NAD-binding domain-containing protein 1 [Microtus ochrogaster]|uniref:Beta-microseminoprotein n=1 Tax=Microtus ochrogaster TaxID=79684 RepID=A0A8J6GGE0_MICOH|nr:Oxidoreductase NAD-binding domain-containing protein 1 [Microtus ochrogaster]